MRLAAQTHCTLEELGERMSAEEFGLWIEFQNEEPIGPQAHWLWLAEILASLANGPLKPPAGSKSFSASDFLKRMEFWQPPAAAAPPVAPVDQFNAFIKPG